MIDMLRGYNRIVTGQYDLNVGSYWHFQFYYSLFALLFRQTQNFELDHDSKWPCFKQRDVNKEENRYKYLMNWK